MAVWFDGVCRIEKKNILQKIRDLRPVSEVLDNANRNLSDRIWTCFVWRYLSVNYPDLNQEPTLTLDSLKKLSFCYNITVVSQIESKVKRIETLSTTHRV